MGYGPLRLDMYCTVFFLVFTWHGMPIHLCAHSIGPCSWTPTAARPWQEVVFLLLFQCISRVGVGWGMLTFLVSGTQRNWRVGLGWGGVGHVLTFMWTCRWRTCSAVAAGGCMYSWVGWGGVGLDNKVHGSLSFIGLFSLLYVLLSCALMGHAIIQYVLLSFALMRHATLLYVLLNFAFMRDATLLYVLLNCALMGHATLLYVLLNFALMRHAHYRMFSWALHSCVMLR